MDKISERYVAMAEDEEKAMDCTCYDDVIRDKESEIIWNFIQYVRILVPDLKILDLGCANGYTIDRFCMPGIKWWGIDACSKMIQNAIDRQLAGCTFAVGDAKRLEFPNGMFGAVITQRCLINIPDWSGQREALSEIHRVLADDGYYLMIECFTDGLDNNNAARVECGLEPLGSSEFNTYFDKDRFCEFVKGKFVFIESTGWQYNFLSSHYFISRVLHALVTRGDQIKNTAFVKFFADYKPIGNFSPLQCHVLQRV